MNVKVAEQTNTLNVKFTKTDTAAFVSHIDMLNAIKRTIKRADYHPALSIGYNVRTILKLSTPLPLGIKSFSEYFSIILQVDDKAEFLKKCNGKSPQGIVFDKAWITAKNPNFAGNIVAADYSILNKKAYELRDTIYRECKESFVVPTRKDNGEKEAKDLIYNLEIDENAVTARLAIGNPNLRVDSFIDVLNKKYHLDIGLGDISKVCGYYKHNGKLLVADEYLDSVDLYR